MCRSRFKPQLCERDAATAIVEVVEASCLNLRWAPICDLALLYTCMCTGSTLCLSLTEQMLMMLFKMSNRRSTITKSPSSPVTCLLPKCYIIIMGDFVLYFHVLSADVYRPFLRVAQVFMDGVLLYQLLKK